MEILGVTPDPGEVPRAHLLWRRACRLMPARFQAADCFEQVPDLAEDAGAVADLIRLASLSSIAGPGAAALLDPAQVLFGPGAGWINASFLRPRPGRFSTARQGAFYAADGIETAMAEVRHHLQARLVLEGVGRPLDLDYRALLVRMEGDFHDLRGLPWDREPWAALLDPQTHGPGQRFAARLREAGSTGLAYPSVRRHAGTCAAAFDPNALRACRHDTYLTFRWNGRRVVQVYEKRMLPLP